MSVFTVHRSFPQAGEPPPLPTGFGVCASAVAATTPSAVMAMTASAIRIVVIVRQRRSLWLTPWKTGLQLGLVGLDPSESSTRQGGVKSRRGG